MPFFQIPSSRDNIAALSSGPGPAAVAVIRMSGPGVKKIVSKVLRKAICLKRPRELILDDFLEESGRLVDRVLAVFFPGPNSYTGEDMVEVHCHGGKAVYRRILQRIFAEGAREALPGEFTRRAFENGKLDLTRAEAVMHIINARTDQQVKAAAQVLAGKFSENLENIRNQLQQSLAQAEALVDFSDEEIDCSLNEDLANLEKELEKINKNRFLAGAQAIEIAICGKQNVGKSSLLNCLAGRELALVTPIAGTTRDAVRFRTELSGREVEFLDTAGISTEPADLLDELSQEKTKKNASRASLILWVFEASDFVPPPGWCKNPLLVANKIDLIGSEKRDEIQKNLEQMNAVAVSALTGEGIESLLEKVSERLEQEFGPQDGIPMTWQQAEAIVEMVQAVKRARERFLQKETALVAEELRRALDELGRLLGESVDTDVLDLIFSRFCIGK